MRSDRASADLTSLEGDFSPTWRKSLRYQTPLRRTGGRVLLRERTPAIGSIPRCPDLCPRSPVAGSFPQHRTHTEETSEWNEGRGGPWLTRRSPFEGDRKSRIRRMKATLTVSLAQCDSVLG